MRNLRGREGHRGQPARPLSGQDTQTTEPAARDAHGGGFLPSPEDAERPAIRFAGRNQRKRGRTPGRTEQRDPFPQEDWHYGYMIFVNEVLLPARMDELRASAEPNCLAGPAAQFPEQIGNRAVDKMDSRHVRLLVPAGQHIGLQPGVGPGARGKLRNHLTVGAPAHHDGVNRLQKAAVAFVPCRGRFRGIQPGNPSGVIGNVPVQANGNIQNRFAQHYFLRSVSGGV